MYIEFTQEQSAMRELAKLYAVKSIAPIHEEDERIGRFRRELVQEMAELGFWGALIPEEYGGNYVGFLSSVLIVEAISTVSPAYAGHFLTQTAGTGLAILNHGTEEQKRTYLPLLVKADLLGCFAATEPDAGSDVASMRMTATEQRDSYVLNGTKSWITNALEADIGLVFAYTDRKKKHHGISCFIVDLKNTAGIATRSIDKLGQRCSLAGEIVFEGAEVPKDALMGKKGQGFEIFMGLLGNTRLFAAARALGLEESCLEKSIKYAQTREQFGKPIGKFQMVQEQVAEMYANHLAGKLLVYQAAANKDKGRSDILEVAAAKWFACESAVKSADTALKIYGAYGYATESLIQRYIRDSRAFVITEGSSNIQKVIISRALLRL